MKKYAIAPDNVKIADYLTNGKKYEILRYDKKRLFEHSDSFNIIEDFGHEIMCLPKQCAHINYKNWTIVEE